jgi:hypothetical protein
MSQQGPDNTRILVGERHSSHIVRSAFAQFLQPPASRILFVANPSKSGSGAVDQQGPEISVSTFGDTKQTCFSATGMVPGDEPKPGRELASIAERGRVACCGDKCGGSHWPDPLDALKTSAYLTIAAKLPDLAVIGSDPIIRAQQFIVKIMYK